MDETKPCNRLRFKQLEPEPLRHQPVGKRRSSEFESLPPSHLTRSTQTTYDFRPSGVSRLSPTARLIGRLSSNLIVESRDAGVRCE